MQENFRKQAMGFNKKDVIDYIFALNSEKEKNEHESAESIAELTKEKERLLAENEALLKAKEELEDARQQLKAQVADAEISRSRLFEEINESRRMLLDNEREFNIKNEQIAKLIAENEAYAEKCEQYAEISRDVGKTIMESKKMAADIVEKANIEAEEIRKATERMANESLREIKAAQSEVETLKRNLSDMTRACENRIKTVELNLESVSESVSSFASGDKKTESSGAFEAPMSENTEGESTQNRDFF